MQLILMIFEIILPICYYIIKSIFVLFFFYVVKSIFILLNQVISNVFVKNIVYIKFQHGYKLTD